MPDAILQKARQPKLRSSCDECGAAKLKCDRGCPRCGRCITLGLDCIYGVSRKMGKPPRDRLRVAAGSSVTHGTVDGANGFNSEKVDEFASSNDGAGAIGDGLTMDPESYPVVNNMPLSWGAFDGYAANLMTAGDGVDLSSTVLLGLPLPDPTSADFNHDLFHTYASPGTEQHSTQSTQRESSVAQRDKNVGFENTVPATPSGSEHDCGPEAYAVLTSLSSPSSNRAHAMSLPAHAQTTLMKIGNSHRVPVDQMLRINREASGRLGHLLSCPCSRRPHLALLCASIISLILTLYQQAAGCSQTDQAMATSSRPISSPGSNIMTGIVDGGSSNSMVNGAMAPALESAQMTMGSFEVDDQEVKAALTIQLVLGEIKRAGHLIDLLTSRSSSGMDESSVDGVDSLYRSLTSWFRREHSRIVENLKSRLEEISP